MTKEIPFRIDRSRPHSLVRQMTDSLRDAIESGYYRQGEQLPTIHEWTRELDVSIRVPEGAIANLAKEGLVVTRPRKGCMVLPQGRRTWRGHVLFVRLVKSWGNFVREGLLSAEEKLSREGYLVTMVVVRKNDRGIYDLGPLKNELRRSVRLAVVFGHQPKILECLADAKVPFVYADIDMEAEPFKGSAAYLDFSRNAAFGAFVAHCVRAGVSHVCVVGKVESFSLVGSMLEEVGIRVTRIDVNAAFGQERVDSLERETCRAIDSLFERHGFKWLPDVIFVEDDYQATGALFSLLSHGVKMPDDVRFATTKNCGNGPAMSIPLTCVEFNP
ncbi:MAG: GntR family transcriptional regulator, partial [Kiritimatiellae bacterium]|nr:GntR family transcriptional regulator [Kiritimatiellia bacterium]